MSNASYGKKFDRGGNKKVDDEKNLYRTIASRVRRLRSSWNCSRNEMARRFGITPNAYGKNETGYSRPGMHTLYLLAKDYDISMDWFLFNKGPMNFAKRTETAKSEKKAEVLKQEPQTKQPEKTITELAPEIQELLDHMEKLPELRYGVLAHFHHLKRELEKPVPTPKE
jgi:transcriptional regulator with XRE-family HTH domain